MNYIRIIFLSLALVVSITVVNAKDKKPNVITILLDDAGWGDIGYHGGDIATPQIDKLANEAVRLKEFYAFAVCTPSRTAFLIGKAPSRIGYEYPRSNRKEFGIPSEVETLAEVFKFNGYQTAIIGKWHIGTESQHLPTSQGFDYQYGNLGGWVDHYTHKNPDNGYDWNRNCEPIEHVEKHSTDLFTDEAINYIQKTGDKPFYIYLSYTAPHVPIQVDEKWTKPYIGKFKDRTRIGYAGMMAHVDDAIGQVINTLEEEGKLDNTLIVFMSDNGPSAPGKKWYIPDDGTISKNYYGNDGKYGDVANLRGWKASRYEGGVKVPAFIYWKGKLKSIDRTDFMVVHDLYPTIINLADLKTSGDYQHEARDILSSKVQTTGYWRTAIEVAIKSGNWKLILKNATPYEDLLDAELFNIAEDISESNNCASNYPDKLNEMIALLKIEYDKDPTLCRDPNVIKRFIERSGDDKIGILK